jgi:hypothetical protein
LQDGRFIPYITLDYKRKEASMQFYEKKDATDITPSDAMEHPVPTVYSIREKDGQLIIVYVHYFLVRRCIYNIVQKTYKDQMKYSFAEYYNFCFDNAIYGIENQADMDRFKMPEYHKFMKGVKYDFTGKLDFDEDFENPVVIEQILK